MTNGTSRFRTGVVAALSIQLALSGPTATVSAATGYQVCIAGSSHAPAREPTTPVGTISPACNASVTTVVVSAAPSQMAAS